eukprot:SAG11_NODE_8912_length_963_cov_1.787037_1_plen_121_part_00
MRLAAADAAFTARKAAVATYQLALDLADRAEATAAKKEEAAILNAEALLTEQCKHIGIGANGQADSENKTAEAHTHLLQQIDVHRHRVIDFDAKLRKNGDAEQQEEQGRVSATVAVLCRR